MHAHVQIYIHLHTQDAHTVTQCTCIHDLPVYAEIHAHMCTPIPVYTHVCASHTRLQSHHIHAGSCPCSPGTGPSLRPRSTGATCAVLPGGVATKCPTLHAGICAHTSAARLRHSHRGPLAVMQSHSCCSQARPSLFPDPWIMTHPLPFLS